MIQDLNSCSSLKWKTVPLSDSIDFLDLTIMIDSEGHITTKTYQKPENLFLYISPHSAHPPGLVKSLVFGILSTYHFQNSLHSDFLLMVRHFFNRLVNRGHNKETLRVLFLEAIQIIEDRCNHTTIDSKKLNDTSELALTDNRIFFHLPFHPRDISRKKIRDIYESTCENDEKTNFKHTVNKRSCAPMQIHKLTVAYHRPKNLRDVLCPSALSESESCHVSKYL